MAGIAVDALKRAAAGGGFGKTVKAGMERGQALVQARVERRVRQSAQQRHDRLIGQIVGKEQVGIGDRGTHCNRNVIRIRLIDDGRGRFQLLDDDGPFLGGDSGGRRGPRHAPDYLLIVLDVQGILGLGRGQHLVQVAGASQVPVFDRGVGQKFGDFVDVGALAGFVQQQQQRIECARIVAHARDHGMQAAQEFGGVRRQQAISVPRINVDGLAIMTEAGATFGQQEHALGVVMDGEQFLGNGGSLGQVSDLQVRLEQVRQTFGMRVEIGSFLQEGDGALGIVAFEGGLATEQQDVAAFWIEGQHALENVFGGGERTARAQRFRHGAEDLPSLFLFVQPDVDFGEFDAHGHIFRVHFEDLLEKAHGLLQVAILHETFGDLHVLGAGVVEQPLLGVKFRQLEGRLHARLQLGDLLVHGDALDREALRGIGVAHHLEARDGLFSVAETGVEIADGVIDGKILGVVLEDLVVLSNGVLQLALLHEFFRCAENPLFVKTKTKRHRIRTPAFFPPNASV